MATATLPDNVRDERRDARRKLSRLAEVVAALDDAERLKAKRLQLWHELRALDPPVSWADIARVSGVNSVTVIQAVEGRGSGT